MRAVVNADLKKQLEPQVEITDADGHVVDPDSEDDDDLEREVTAEQKDEDNPEKAEDE